MSALSRKITNEDLARALIAVLRANPPKFRLTPGMARTIIERARREANR